MARQRGYTLNLFARVEEGAVNWGPGPRPYREPDTNVNIGAWTDDQLAEINILPVLIDYDDQFDPDIQSMLEPVLSVENGIPVQTQVYEYQPNARGKMKAKINQHFNDLAAQTYDLTPLLYIEHLFVEDEARRAAADPDPDPVNYPLLEKGIGVSRDENGVVAQSLQDEVDIVLGTASQMRSTLTMWRGERITTRADIDAAATDDGAFATYRSVIPAPPIAQGT